MPSRELVEETLEKFGGFYGFDDVIEAIHAGKMQSFTDGDTWIVTQVSVFPRKKVLEVVLAVGTFDGVLRLQPEIVEFAKQHNCDMMWAEARPGWERMMTPGWECRSKTYVRKL